MGRRPGQKSAAGKRVIGSRAARLFRQRQAPREPVRDQKLPLLLPAASPPRPALGAAFAGAILMSRLWNRRGGSRQATGRS